MEGRPLSHNDAVIVMIVSDKCQRERETSVSVQCFHYAFQYCLSSLGTSMEPIPKTVPGTIHNPMEKQKQQESCRADTMQ